MSDNNRCGKNTDIEIWREKKDDYYADSIHITEKNDVGLNCGGPVQVKPIREWHKLAEENAKLKQELNIHIKMVADYVNERAEIIEEKEEAKAEALKDRTRVVKFLKEQKLREVFDLWYDNEIQEEQDIEDESNQRMEGLG